jgi:hypothetical protein
MRLLRGIHGALVILAVGATEAWAACCATVTPVHVYVPHVTHVVIPHTTYVRPVTPQAHPHTSTSTLRINRNPTTLPAVQTRPPHSHHVVQPIVVNNQVATTTTRCKRQQGGDGCKKKEDEQTGWATVRRWLQLDKH